MRQGEAGVVAGDSVKVDNVQIQCARRVAEAAFASEIGFDTVEFGKQGNAVQGGGNGADGIDEIGLIVVTDGCGHIQ